MLTETTQMAMAEKVHFKAVKWGRQRRLSEDRRVALRLARRRLALEERRA